jgi:hypothetical protein
MDFNFKNIGISGVAGSGKNTLAEILQMFFSRLQLPTKELSIARNLKEEISPICKDLYSIDSLNCSREEKNLIRPMLVAHGEIKRKMTKGTHWTSLLQKDLEKDKINIITDIRYAEYPEDENFWLKNKANGILIHVSRYDQVEEEREYIQPANPSEEKNDYRVKKLSDFCLNWKTEKNYGDMIFNSRKLLKWLKKIYVE